MEDKILNPKTGRYVKKTSKIGREIVEAARKQKRASKAARSFKVIRGGDQPDLLKILKLRNGKTNLDSLKSFLHESIFKKEVQNLTFSWQFGILNAALKTFLKPPNKWFFFKSYVNEQLSKNSANCMFCCYDLGNKINSEKVQCFLKLVTISYNNSLKLIKSTIRQRILRRMQTSLDDVLLDSGLTRFISCLPLEPQMKNVFMESLGSYITSIKKETVKSEQITELMGIRIKMPVQDTVYSFQAKLLESLYEDPNDMGKKKQDMMSNDQVKDAFCMACVSINPNISLGMVLGNMVNASFYQKQVSLFQSKYKKTPILFKELAEPLINLLSTIHFMGINYGFCHNDCHLHNILVTIENVNNEKKLAFKLIDYGRVSFYFEQGTSYYKLLKTCIIDEIRKSDYLPIGISDNETPLLGEIFTINHVCGIYYNDIVKMKASGVDFIGFGAMFDIAFISVEVFLHLPEEERKKVPFLELITPPHTNYSMMRVKIPEGVGGIMSLFDKKLKEEMTDILRAILPGLCYFVLYLRTYDLVQKNENMIGKWDSTTMIENVHINDLFHISGQMKDHMFMRIYAQFYLVLKESTFLNYIKSTSSKIFTGGSFTENDGDDETIGDDVHTVLKSASRLVVDSVYTEAEMIQMEEWRQECKAMKTVQSQCYHANISGIYDEDRKTVDVYYGLETDDDVRESPYRDKKSSEKLLAGIVRNVLENKEKTTSKRCAYDKRSIQCSSASAYPVSIQEPEYPPSGSISAPAFRRDEKK